MIVGRKNTLHSSQVCGSLSSLPFKVPSSCLGLAVTVTRICQGLDHHCHYCKNIGGQCGFFNVGANWVIEERLSGWCECSKEMWIRGILEYSIFSLAIGSTTLSVDSYGIMVTLVWLMGKHKTLPFVIWLGSYDEHANTGIGLGRDRLGQELLGVFHVLEQQFGPHGELWSWKHCLPSTNEKNKESKQKRDTCVTPT